MLTGRGSQLHTKPLTISESFQKDFCLDHPIFAVNESILAQATATISPTAAPPNYVWRFFDSFGARHLRFENINHTAVQICIKEPVDVEEYRTSKISKVVFGVAAAHTDSLDIMQPQLNFFNHSIAPVWLIDTNDVAPRFVNVSSMIARAEEGFYERFCVIRFKVIDEDFAPFDTALKVSVKSISPPSTNFEGGATFTPICNESTSYIETGMTSSSCCLVLSGMLDFETIQSYVIQLEVADGSDELKNQVVLKDSIEVVVVVNDVDDTAPIFTKQVYKASLPEDAKVGTEIVQVKARDGDIRLMNPVVYSMVNDSRKVSLLSSFAIDPQTGVIRLVRSIDREAKEIAELPGNEIIMEVEAREVKKFPTWRTISSNATSICTVAITIVDIDDNDPVFSASSYQLNAIYSPVSNKWTVDSADNQPILVADADQGTNARYRLSIFTSWSAFSLFKVSPTVATGSTAAELTAIENNTVFQNFSGSSWIGMLKAESMMPGNHGEYRVATADVTVNILPANTEGPRFAKKSYHFEVKENSPDQTVVGRLSAIDFDRDHFGMVTYDIASASTDAEMTGDVESTMRPFEIDPLTGVITVNAGPGKYKLNREVTPEFLLFVTAVDGGGLSDSTLVTVKLIDENDNGPVFLPSTCSHATVPEETLGVIPNCIIHIFDADSSPNNDTMVTVTGVDFWNDSPSADSSAMKSAPINKEMFRLTRHFDGEIDSNPRGGSKWVLQVVSSIDVDKLRHHSQQLGDFIVLIAIRAEDTKKLVGNVAQGHADITIQLAITDINDNAPECFSSTKLGSFSVDVAENATSGEIVSHVLASDNDEPHSSNSKITFSWAENEQSSNVIAYQTNPFSLNPDTGEIRLSPGQSLDKDNVGSYNLTIRLQDLGNPPQNNTCIMSVNVIDINNKPPQFSPSSIKYVSVVENLTPDKVLAVMSAEDPDSNADLEYNIVIDQVAAEFGPSWVDPQIPVETITKNATMGEQMNDFIQHASTLQFSTSNHLKSLISKLFSIDKRNGFVYLHGSLDRELFKNIKLPIQVKDLNAASPGQTAIGTLIVQVDNVNDEFPWFDHKDNFYSFRVAENTPVDTRLGSIKCVDVDLGDETRISVDDPNSVIEIFTIGDVFLKQPLDYEKHRQINVTVTCSDQSDHKTKGIVSIVVIDSNDCTPRFDTAETNAIVPENSPIGEVVVEIKADDCDSGDFGDLNYFIVEGNNFGHFKIDSKTGIVYVANNLDAELNDNYQLKIMVKDNPVASTTNATNSAFKTLNIAIADVNDCPPKFSNHSVWLGQFQAQDVYAGIRVEGTPLAKDNDKTAANSGITYSIENLSNPGLFVVDGSTGIVRVASNVTREALWPILGTIYSFKITAQDTAPEPLSDFAIVSMRIFEPDFVPKMAQEAKAKKANQQQMPVEEFSKKKMSFSLSEEKTGCFANVAVESCCTNVSAAISESVFAGNFETKFKGDQLEICAVKAFDRESLNQHLETDAKVFLQLLLKIHGVSQVSNCKCNEEIQLELEITDINDNAPTFITPSLLSRALTPLSQDHDSIIKLKEFMIDRDETADLSSLRFSIAPFESDVSHFGSFSQFFNLDPISGEITVLPSNKRNPVSLYNGDGYVKCVVSAIDTANGAATSRLSLSIPIVQNLTDLVDIVVRLPTQSTPQSTENILPENETDRIKSLEFVAAFNKAMSTMVPPLRINQAGSSIRFNPALADHHLLHIVIHELDSERLGKDLRSVVNNKRTARPPRPLPEPNNEQSSSLAVSLMNAYRNSEAVAKVFSDFPVIKINVSLTFFSNVLKVI